MRADSYVSPCGIEDTFCAAQFGDELVCFAPFIDFVFQEPAVFRGKYIPSTGRLSAVTLDSEDRTCPINAILVCLFDFILPACFFVSTMANKDNTIRFLVNLCGEGVTFAGEAYPNSFFSAFPYPSGKLGIGFIPSTRNEAELFGDDGFGSALFFPLTCFPIGNDI